MSGPLIRVNNWTPEDQKRALASFWMSMGPVIALAVDQSFFVAKMRNPSIAEVKHRTLLAKECVQEMVELKWSRARIRDVLPRTLTAKLVTVRVDLKQEAKRSSW